MEVLRYWLQTAARGVLLVVVLLAPWWLGGVEPASQGWLYGGLLAAFALWAAAMLLPTRDAGAGFPLLAVPVVGALLLGAVQLVPWLEPASTHSVSAADTRLCQAHLLMALVVVCLASDLFASAAHQRWLWIGLAIDGAALAVFGIIQKINWNGKLYWTIPLTHGGQPFASYVNRNNATGFLNIALAAAVGWLVWSLSRRRGNSGSPSTDLIRLPGQVHQRWSEMHGDEPVSYQRWHLVGAITAAGLIVAGIASSLSRSGFIGLVGGTLAVLLSLSGRRKLLPVVAVLGCALGLGLVVVHWTGMGRAVEKRLATLGSEQKFADARLTNWRDAWRTAQAFPVAGTGFGTYRVAYRPFQAQHHDVWFQHAENQYLEALVEGGLVGLVLLLAAIAIVFRDVIRLARGRSIPQGDALAACGVFAIVSQCLQGIFDFGLYLPANMMALGMVCGAVAGAAKGAARPAAHQPLFAPRMPMLRLASVAVFAAWCWVALSEVAGATAAHRALAGIPLLTSPNSLELGDVDARLAELNGALEQRPDDAELHVKIADLWVYRYRRLALQRMQPDDARSSRFWRLTDPAVLHREANQHYQFDPPGSVQRIRETPLVAENLVPAVEHLLAARTTCPLLPETEVRLGALAFVRDPDAPQGEPEIRRALQLAATEPVVLYDAGLLARQAGLKDLCFSTWKQSLAVSDVRQRQIINDARGWARIDELIEHLLPENAEVVLDVLSRYYADEHFSVERSLLMQRAAELAEAQKAGLGQSQRHHLQARLHALEGRPELAVESCRQAVALSPLKAGWRFELAQLLKEQGKGVEARTEAEICMSLQPDLPGIRSFIDSLASAVQTRSPNPADAVRFPGQVMNKNTSTNKTRKVTGP
jgi:O-antigen ligase